MIDILVTLSTRAFFTTKILQERCPGNVNVVAQITQFLKTRRQTKGEKFVMSIEALPSIMLCSDMMISLISKLFHVNVSRKMKRKEKFERFIDQRFERTEKSHLSSCFLLTFSSKNWDIILRCWCYRSWTEFIVMRRCWTPKNAQKLDAINVMCLFTFWVRLRVDDRLKSRPESVAPAISLPSAGHHRHTVYSFMMFSFHLPTNGMYFEFSVVSVREFANLGLPAWVDCNSLSQFTSRWFCLCL